ncbi:MAG: TetR/AcrR family transcriptional regulator [Candidatus Delongbacteria bacterium]|nr:TetR/AcrR family transcriptional regulator [Candidatus Delongbacteria bacterium]MBN2834345.1 TetR/AcrR family transcriptional regulator [Candidatus Delongbacteria bacterium]
MNKKEKIQNFHRSEILKATYRLCKRNNMSSVTMRDIAKESEYTLRTIYKYFNCKEELYYELVTLIMEVKAYWLFEIIDRYDDPAEKLLVYMVNNYNYLKKHPIELKLTIFFISAEYDNSGIREETLIAQTERRTILYNYFKEIFEKGISDGLFKDDLNIRYTQDLITQTFRLVMYLVIVLKERPENYFWEYFKIFFRSIFNDGISKIADEDFPEKYLVMDVPEKLDKFDD